MCVYVHQFLQILRTLTYYNSESEPAGDVPRQLYINLDYYPNFQPCSITINILDLPDPPIIHLPEKLA